ncbi:TIGR00341 family protein [bacterium]|nr:TIGR00341 family protein [candidate division CSSED10-310 bacterium]
MALRLIKILLPYDSKTRALEIMGDQVAAYWIHDLNDGHCMVEALVPAEGSEELIDSLSKKFAFQEQFKIILLPVEAVVPRDQVEEGAPVRQPGSSGNNRLLSRISREELYADITDPSRLTTFHILMILLSSVVAGLGILRDNVAVIIGAMVIAPLLGPQVALAFGATLGDLKMIKRAAVTAVAGMMVAYAVSCGWGLFTSVDPSALEVARRTRIDLPDIVLALAAGGAGVLSITTGASTALVGVMVAVALLPPLVTSGLLLGSGHGEPAMGAFLVFLANVICINLAGVLTFLGYGVRPLNWWETSRARRSTVIAVITWALLLIALIAIVCGQ